MKSINCLVLVFALMGLVTGASAQDRAGVEEYLKIADDHYRNARQSDAIENYRKAADEGERLGQVGKFVYALTQIGVILTRQDKYESAAENLNKALVVGLESLGPDDLAVAATYLALGVVYSAQGEFDRSLEVHNKALEIRLAKLGKFDANVATSYGNIGNVQFRKKEYDRAIEAHTIAMEIRARVLGVSGPEIAESYNGLGNAFREKKEYPRALDYFERALANKITQLGDGHGGLARYFLQISEVHALAGNRSEAEKYKVKAQAVAKPQG